MLSHNLAECLFYIDCVFDIKQLLSEKGYDENSVVNYYSQSDLGYRIFHSLSGSVHMSLNYNGVFNTAGYFEQAEIVDEYIKKMRRRTFWHWPLIFDRKSDSRTAEADNCIFKSA